ncbi:hypothetical protein ACYPKM_01625 [Pseudomonas aeruginosa]
MKDNAEHKLLEYPAAVVVDAQNDDGYIISKHAMLNIDLPVGTLLYTSPVAEGWKNELPTEPGLYALKEPFTSASVSPFNVYAVTQARDGHGLIYGGFRRVEDAPEGTIWHRLCDLPTPEQAS